MSVLDIQMLGGKMEQQIIIETSDTELITALRAEHISDISVAQRIFTCDSPDWAPCVDSLITVVVTSSSTVALSLLSSWLYDRVVKKKPNKTTINNTNIINNPKEITIIIDNSIKIIKNNKEEK